MNTCLQLDPDGLWEYTVVDEAVGERVQIVPTDEIFKFLNYHCMLHKSITLGDIFETVDNYPTLVELLKQSVPCKWIAEIHALAKEPYEKRPRDPELKCLEVYRHCQFHPNEVLGVNLGVAGIGVKPDKYHISVSYEFPNFLTSLPVRLNLSWKLYRRGMDSSLKCIVDAAKYFTLLEILEAIYEDVCWNGLPQDELDLDLEEDFGDEDEGPVTVAPMEDLIPSEERKQWEAEKKLESMFDLDIDAESN